MLDKRIRAEEEKDTKITIKEETLIRQIIIIGKDLIVEIIEEIMIIKMIGGSKEKAETQMEKVHQIDNIGMILETEEKSIIIRMEVKEINLEVEANRDIIEINEDLK